MKKETKIYVAPNGLKLKAYNKRINIIQSPYKQHKGQDVIMVEIMNVIDLKDHFPDESTPMLEFTFTKALNIPIQINRLFLSVDTFIGLKTMFGISVECKELREMMVRCIKAKESILNKYIMAEFIERIKQEKSDLDDKLEKLEKFLGSDKSLELTKDEKVLLSEQHKLMLLYSKCLQKRLNLYV